MTLIPKWTAYRDLFRVLEDKNRWSRPQLVDELNKDAKEKQLVKCTYSERTLEYYEQRPQYGKQPRTPRYYRIEHLHAFIREQIGNIGETNKYAALLAAIEPTTAETEGQVQRWTPVVANQPPDKQMPVKVSDARALALAGMTYFKYRSAECPALMSSEVVAHLQERYQCEPIVLSSIPLPIAVLWRNQSELVPPDTILGSFDASPPTALRSSAILNERDYAEARKFIGRKYTEPPSKVTYEGVDYRMTSIDLDSSLPVVNGAFGWYYDNILTQCALEWEMRKALLENPGGPAILSRKGLLPLRESIENAGNPLVSGTGRCAAIAVSMLLVFRRRKGDLYTIVRKRSMAVGVAAGLHHVAPAGMFEAPNTGDAWSLEDSLWRELLEEVYDEEEQIGTGCSEIRDHVRGIPPIPLLLRLIQDGAAELSVTGICCDLLRLWPEICTILWVPSPKLGIERKMCLNWEYETEGPAGTFGITWSRLPQIASDLATSRRLVAAGGACIELGRQWLAARHGV